MKIKDNQSLLDIVIQTSGSVESIFELAVANNLSITDEMVIGAEIKTVPVKDVKVVEYYKKRNLVPGTAIVKIDPTKTGIDYWIIEKDFVVG